MGFGGKARRGGSFTLEASDLEEDSAKWISKWGGAVTRHILAFLDRTGRAVDLSIQTDFCQILRLKYINLTVYGGDCAKIGSKSGLIVEKVGHKRGRWARSNCIG